MASLVPTALGQDSSFVKKDTNSRMTPVVEINDVLIRRPLISTSSVVPIYHISEDRINALGARDLGDAIRFIPGVQLKDYGGIGGLKTISYRSLGAAHTGVTLDGMYIPNVQSGATNLSNFELFSLRSVRFSVGSPTGISYSASEYVPANMMSLTSIFNEAPDTLRLGTYTNLTSVNNYEHGVYYQQRLTKRLFAGGQLFYKHGNGQYDFLHPELPNGPVLTRQNTTLQNFRTRGVIGYNGRKWFLRGNFAYQDSDQELPGAAVLFNPSNDQKLWRTTTRADVLAQKTKLGRHFRLFANYQKERTRYLDPNFLNLQGFIDLTYLQENTTVGFSRLRWLDAKPGTIERYRPIRFSYGTDLRYSTLAGDNFATSPRRIKSTTFLSYYQQYKNITYEAALIFQGIADYTTNESTDQTYVRLSPFVSFKWELNDDFQIRGFYKNVFRMPTFNDLYYNFIGNNGLRPENAHLTNWGFNYTHSEKRYLLQLEVDGYYSRVSDKIVAIPTKDLFNWSMQNIGETAITGVDLNLMFVLKTKKIQWSLSTGQTLNRSLDITDPESATYKSQIPYTPYYSATYTSIIDYRGFGLNTSVVHSGFRFSLNENTYANLLEGYVDLNVGLSKQITTDRSRYLIDVKVMNLLGNNYEIIRSFPVPGRYYQLRLTYKFEK